MIPDYLTTLFSLANRTAVVTGAARGNGLAMAEALAKAGATVMLVDILGDDLRAQAERLRSLGTNCDCHITDLSQEEGIASVVQALRARGLTCDILVNNAGITAGAGVLEYPAAAWDRTFCINLRAPFLLVQAIAKAFMVPRNRGVIINITSLNAELAFPDNPAYVACKGGLKALTHSLALDLGKYGIRVNAIGPGYIHTAMTAKSFASPELNQDRRNRTVLGRWGEPADLAGAVVFLASDASSYVTGASLYVDGGWLIKGL